MSDARTRIAFLTDKLAYGGTPLHVVKLVTNLDPKYYEPHLVVLSRAEPDLVRRIERNRVELHVVGRDNWTRPVAFISLLRLQKILRGIKPQILHAFLPTSNVLAASVGKFAGIPVTITSHRDLGGFDGKWITRLNGWLDRHVSTCVTANSIAVRDAVMQRCRLDRDQVKVIYNGIRLANGNASLDPAQKRRELGLDSSEVVAAVVANIKEAKGHRFLIEAFGRIAQRIPQARLLLCGYVVESEFGAELKRQIHEMNIKEQVKLLGSRTDIDEILRAVDFLIAPSLSEGFSNSILEAMAAGLPVVATDVGGNREQIEPGVSGLLVPPANSQALEAAMATLFSSRTARRQMGSSAGKRVRELFSMERMIAEHQEFYRELLQRRN